MALTYAFDDASRLTGQRYPDGSRFTAESLPPGKGGEPTRQEVKITAKSSLVFFNVGPGGAKLTEGYHVRGWLAEGSEDTADELMVLRAEKPADKKPDGKREK